MVSRQVFRDGRNLWYWHLPKSVKPTQDGSSEWEELPELEPLDDLPPLEDLEQLDLATLERLVRKGKRQRR